MENMNQNTIFKFGIDDTTKQNLKGLALWAKVNAILAFTSIGMSLLTIILASLKLIDAYSEGYLIGSLISKQLLFWIISLVLNIILYKAATNIQQSIINNDQRVFNIGMSQLARYFKILGIILIVAIILVIAILIIAILVNGFKS
jgi:hypothetical protein